MKCINCKSSNLEEDTRLGECICIECGYVMVSEIQELATQDIIEYEATTSTGHHWGERTSDRGHLGSHINLAPYLNWQGGDSRQQKNRARRLMKYHSRFRLSAKDRSVNMGVLECVMIMSPYYPSSMVKMRERIINYYRRLFMKNTFRGFTMSERASALVLYMLRGNGVPTTVRSIAEENNVKASRVSKCARKIATKLGKPWLLHQMPVFPWADRLCQDLRTSKTYRKDLYAVLDYINNVIESHDLTFTKTHMATTMWITCLLRKGTSFPELTQSRITEACGCSSVALRATQKKLFNLLGLTKKQCEMLTVEQFVAGVKYG